MAVSPFETQRRSRWVQRMLVGANSDFGYEDLPWFKRAMIAIQELGLEGQEVTSGYLLDRLQHVVGLPPHKSYMSSMISRAVRLGVLRRTGRKICMTGRGRSPSYIVVGRARGDRSTHNNQMILEGTDV